MCGMHPHIYFILYMSHVGFSPLCLLELRRRLVSNELCNKARMLDGFSVARVRHAVDRICFSGLLSSRFSALILFKFYVVVEECAGSTLCSRLSKPHAQQIAGFRKRHTCWFNKLARIKNILLRGDKRITEPNRVTHYNVKTQCPVHKQVHIISNGIRILLYYIRCTIYAV